MPCLLALCILTLGAAEQPVLTDELVARLVEKGLPALDPGGRKQALRVTVKQSLKEDKVEFWLLQLEWSEDSRARKGVAFVGRVAGAPQDVPWVSQMDGWGLAPLGFEDRELDSVVAEMKRQRLQAHEAATIGDLRAFLSAEATYEFNNSGYYDTPTCLREPIRCIPGYPPLGPTFLHEDLMDDRNGYRRKFYAGPKPPNPGERASPSSITGFAVTAVPIRLGETGRRGFCADASGIICFTADGNEPPVVKGECPITQKKCEPIP